MIKSRHCVAASPRPGGPTREPANTPPRTRARATGTGQPLRALYISFAGALSFKLHVVNHATQGGARLHVRQLKCAPINHGATLHSHVGLHTENGIICYGDNSRTKAISCATISTAPRMSTEAETNSSGAKFTTEVVAVIMTNMNGYNLKLRL